MPEGAITVAGLTALFLFSADLSTRIFSLVPGTRVVMFLLAIGLSAFVALEGDFLAHWPMLAFVLAGALAYGLVRLTISRLFRPKAG